MNRSTSLFAISIYVFRCHSQFRVFNSNFTSDKNSRFVGTTWAFKMKQAPYITVKARYPEVPMNFLFPYAPDFHILKCLWEHEKTVIIKLK